jgi:hypothetical protein
LGCGIVYKIDPRRDFPNARPASVVTECIAVVASLAGSRVLVAAHDGLAHVRDAAAGGNPYPDTWCFVGPPVAKAGIDAATIGDVAHISGWAERAILAVNDAGAEATASTEGHDDHER